MIAHTEKPSCPCGFFQDLLALLSLSWGQGAGLSENTTLHLGRSYSLLKFSPSQTLESLERGKAGAAQRGLFFHRRLEESWGSLQTPKSLLVMEPTMVLSASQVKPLSQGHL